MIGRMFNSGAMPALERLVQFTSRRHGVITNNIANLSTPYFKPRDLDPERFQAALGEAIEHRREGGTPQAGELEMHDTRQLTFHEGGMEAKPTPKGENVLFHDRNNRSLERIMQDLAENTLMHKTGVRLLKSEFDMLRTAIRGRM